MSEGPDTAFMGNGETEVIPAPESACGIAPFLDIPALTTIFSPGCDCTTTSNTLHVPPLAPVLPALTTEDQYPFACRKNAWFLVFNSYASYVIYPSSDSTP